MCSTSNGQGKDLSRCKTLDLIFAWDAYVSILTGKDKALFSESGGSVTKER